MRPFIEMTGVRHGMLVVVAHAGRNRHKHHVWLCRCDCGNEKVVEGAYLRTGHTRSCGCATAVLIGTRRRRHGHAPLGNPSREYITWNGMKRRCYSPKVEMYPIYGGRGIKVCDRWRDSFEAFLADMGPKPAGFSLDRIDPDGNYEPGNCRWATAGEQSRNRRTARMLTINGVTRNLSEWSRLTGLRHTTILWRLRNGKPIEAAIDAQDGRKHVPAALPMRTPPA